MACRMPHATCHMPRATCHMHMHMRMRMHKQRTTMHKHARIAHTLRHLRNSPAARTHMHDDKRTRVRIRPLSPCTHLTSTSPLPNLPLSPPTIHLGGSARGVAVPATALSTRGDTNCSRSALRPRGLHTSPPGPAPPSCAWAQKMMHSVPPGGTRHDGDASERPTTKSLGGCRPASPLPHCTEQQSCVYLSGRVSAVAGAGTGGR